MQICRSGQALLTRPTKPGHKASKCVCLPRTQLQMSQMRRLTPVTATKETEKTQDTEAPAGAESVSAPQQESSSPEDAIRKQLELRRSQQRVTEQSSSNIIQGALEEAQLISWPQPKKALLDTLLVLAIVSGTGLLLFSVNVLLTDASNLWYSK